MVVIRAWSQLETSHRAKGNLKGCENYPVMNLAYDDSEAYAKWAGKRLPTETEWEFAARGGLSGKLFVWGDEFRPRGQWMAITFQGRFPLIDTGADGHVGITPVGTYPPNGYMACTTWPEMSGTG
jgi:formylglycine-generating enzyme required for sulfatase activity